MREWKKFGFMFILFSFILILVTACNNSSETSSSTSSESADKDEEKITLKFATHMAGTSPMYYGFIEPWMERVVELTDGQVEFDYYPSEQLGKGPDMLDLTKNGVTDISMVISDYSPDQMPLTSFLSNYPNLSESVHQGTLALNKFLKENDVITQTDFLNNGVYPIMALVPPGDDIWSTDKEIRTPEDIKGFKVRTKGGMVNTLYEYLEATPISVSFAEMYEALERGVADGAATYNMAVKNAGLHELIDYMTPLQIGASIQSIVINENVWQSLPEHIQDAMTEAAKEATENVGAIYEQEIEEFMKEFEANATVVDLTEEEKQLWNDAFNEWSDKWLEENKDNGLPYEEVLEEYRKYLEEFKE